MIDEDDDLLINIIDVAKFIKASFIQNSEQNNRIDQILEKVFNDTKIDKKQAFYAFLNNNELKDLAAALLQVHFVQIS